MSDVLKGMRESQSLHDQISLHFGFTLMRQQIRTMEYTEGRDEGESVVNIADTRGVGVFPQLWSTSVPDRQCSLLGPILPRQLAVGPHTLHRYLIRNPPGAPGNQNKPQVLVIINIICWMQRGELQSLLTQTCGTSHST